MVLGMRNSAFARLPLYEGKAIPGSNLASLPMRRSRRTVRLGARRVRSCTVAASIGKGPPGSRRALMFVRNLDGPLAVSDQNE